MLLSFGGAVLVPTIPVVNVDGWTGSVDPEAPLVERPRMGRRNGWKIGSGSRWTAFVATLAHRR